MKIAADDGQFLEDVFSHPWDFVEEEDSEGAGSDAKCGGHDGAAWSCERGF